MTSLLPSVCAPAASGEDTPYLTVLVVSFNTRDILRECIQAVEKHSASISIEIIVVDNASIDGSSDMVLTEFPEVRLVRKTVNTGFGNANNLGFELARGRYIVL